MKNSWKIILAAIACIGMTMPSRAQQTAPAQVNGGVYNSTAPTLNNGQSGVFQLDASGNLKVAPSTISGTVNLQAASIGGCIPTYFLTVATSNSRLIQGGPTTLCSVTATTTATTVNYVKLYNSATAPVCQTASISATYAISSTAQLANPAPSFGLAFPLGLGVCITGQITSSDSSAALAGAAINFGYK